MPKHTHMAPSIAKADRVPRVNNVTQLALRYDDRYVRGASWGGILDEINRIVGIVGLKQAAYDLDAQPSQLAHALAERDRHYIRAEWLPYFLAKAPDAALAEALAACSGLDVAPRRELTPAEKLDRVVRVLEQSGPAGAAVLAEAGIK